MRRLVDKVAWITGAGSGIGEAAAIALAEEGAAVVLTGRRKEPLDHVAEQIVKKGGVAHVQQGDMSKFADASRIAASIDRDLGRLDILVNNAGSNIPDRSWRRLTPSGLDDLLQSNLFSSFYGVMAVLPIMRRQQNGLIISTASIAGRFVSTQPGAGYIAAKHGVVALSTVSIWKNVGTESGRRPSARAKSRRRSSRNAQFQPVRKTRRACSNRRIWATLFAISPVSRLVSASTIS